MRENVEEDGEDSALATDAVQTAVSTSTEKVVGETGASNAAGVTGRATDGSSKTYGVVGETQASNDNSAGVYGTATATSDGVYGVVGETQSFQSNAAGVYGSAPPGGNAVAIEADGQIVSNANLDLDKEGNDLFRQLYMGTNGRFFYNPDHEGSSLIGPSDADFFWLAQDLNLHVERGVVSIQDRTVQRTAGPIAKGFVNADGTIEHGHQVDSVTYNSSLTRYEISIANVSYNGNDFATVVTPYRAGGAVAETDVIGGDLVVEVRDMDGNLIQSDFQFVTHELDPGAVSTSTTAVDSTANSPDSP